MTGSAPVGLDLAALRRFFDRVVPGAGDVSAELLHGGRSNLTYRITDGVSSWVLRRPPLGELTPSAHDMTREFRVVKALQGSGVPVAPAVALEEGTSVLGVPFAVVGYVDGVVLRTQEELAGFSDFDVTRCAYSLIEILARLHSVDVEEAGLSGFGRPQGYLARQLRRWQDQWGRVSTRPLPSLDRLHARLVETCPQESGESIVHGDYRIDNAILDPHDPAVVRALVDWEMATLGDPLADLGLHLAYSDPAFDPVLGGSAASTSARLPSAADLVEKYAELSGRPVENLPFYRGFGYFKAAVIAEGIHARYRQGLTVGDGFETVGAAVEQLVEAGTTVVR
ncbi:MAG TPA: phosphotransferase family protein [Amycolatopsis sp.]|jgi:aminoglycoside phosphotransferase (APT) family kinase protein|nr:phosphotransferase family protein [Amycolatopsis sp.]